jgi:hypothetical protein
MRSPSMRFTMRQMMMAVAFLAVSIGVVRAWRRQVYCSGWAEVWAINEESKLREARNARMAHQEGHAVACEGEAARFSRLRGEYERTAFRFWEPVPRDSPAPPELR